MTALLTGTTATTEVEHLTGELDAVTGPEVRRRLETWEMAGIDELVVDLAGVTDMDAAGLSAIVMARRYLRRHGVDLVLTGTAGPAVRRMLAVTRFSQVFDLGQDA